MVRMVEVVEPIVTDSVDGLKEGPGDKDPVEAFTTAGVCGCVRLLWVEVGERIVQVACGTD